MTLYQEWVNNVMNNLGVLNFAKYYTHWKMESLKRSYPFDGHLIFSRARLSQANYVCISLPGNHIAQYYVQSGSNLV